MSQQTVLVTGAAGAMGRVIAPALKEAGFNVHGFDRDDGEHVTHRGDLTDAAAVEVAMTGCEAVVHLGACSDVADFVETLVPANVVGLYHIFDACRRLGVKKVIMASTGRVTGGKRSREAAGAGGVPVIGTESVAPRDHYALTKLWAEQMGEMYARCHGLSVLAVRIGWFTRNADECRRLIRGDAQGVYLSHADAARFFTAAVMADLAGFHVVFATSKVPQGKTFFDPEPARKLIGYEPRDHFPAGLTFEFYE